MRRTPQRYTEEQRARIIARIEAGESQHEVSRATGIPLATVNRWHVQALEAAGRLDEKLRAPDWTAAYQRASQLAAEIIEATLARYSEEGREITPRDLQSIAIAGGISTDKAIDLRDGRKGTQINVDARSLTLPPGLTLEELRALAFPPEQLNQPG